ncbi:hypothetical protein AC1031_013003 [Aphanomyces cochlioides]|nr:hypothetical protein AC1031_013003 [Aphanomyces cochlioides]
MPVTGFMEEYRSLVEDSVVDAINHREDWIDDARHDNSGWKLTVNKRNMQVFRKKTQSVPHDATSSSLFTFLTVGYLSTTIEDLHTSLYAATSKDDQILHSLLLDKEFLTSQVLAVLDDIALPSLDPDLPDFLGIKYIKLRMPGSRLGVNPRESVYVEYLTLREDNILVKVVHSIDNFLPPHTDGGVIHRATLRDVWLFVPAPNGKIQVVARTFHDMKGSAPKYFSDQSALSFWRVYDKLTSMSYVRRLLAMPHGALRGSLSSLTQSQPITRGSIRRAVRYFPSCRAHFKWNAVAKHESIASVASGSSRSSTPSASCARTAQQSSVQTATCPSITRSRRASIPFHTTKSMSRRWKPTKISSVLCVFTAARRRFKTLTE